MNTKLSIKFADWINSDDCPYIHVKSASGKNSWGKFRKTKCLHFFKR